MPRSDNIRKILILGSGPVTIGQGGELDAAAVQAVYALRGEGFETVAVNPDPAAMMTEPSVADISYVEPLNPDMLAEIIAEESPDALLPGLGGQAALNLTLTMDRTGRLADTGMTVIGTSPESFAKCQDRTVFKAALNGIGVSTPRSRIIDSVDEAEKAAEELGCPLVIHPVHTSGGGGRMVFNRADLPGLAETALRDSTVGQIMVEESLMGWEETEILAVRDVEGRTAALFAVENIDPAGIHAGDSVCVMPPRAASVSLLEALGRQACDAVSELGIIGCAGIQFACDPRSGRAVVIEIDPRVTRSAVFASRISGLPLAALSALLACGFTLDEAARDDSLSWAGKERLKALLSGPPPLSESPSDLTAVWFPRWDFHRFDEAEERLDIQMRATGQVMGVGKTFPEALNRAVRALGTGSGGLGDPSLLKTDVSEMTLDECMIRLTTPDSERFFLIYEALKKGGDAEKISGTVRISRWFIDSIQEMVQIEAAVKAEGGFPSRDLLIRTKQAGISDVMLGRWIGLPETEVREKRKAAGVVPDFFQTHPEEDGCPVLYPSYHKEAPGSGLSSEEKRILIIGSGPHRIGASTEFDNCCALAGAAFAVAGWRPVFVNANPASAAFESPAFACHCLTPPAVEDVCDLADMLAPRACVLQFGGRRAMKLRAELEAAGLKIPGSDSGFTLPARNRRLFREKMKAIGLPQPPFAVAGTEAGVKAAAEKLGYPLIVRFPYAGPGRGVEIIYDPSALTDLLNRSQNRIGSSDEASPLYLERFIENAVEVSVDAVSDGAEIFIPELAEHIERAGVHGGDSAYSIPPLVLSPIHLETIRVYTQKIASEMEVKGLIHLRFAVADGTVFVLEALPGASRTVPVISKITGVSLTALAVGTLLGKKLAELRPKSVRMNHLAVKESAFPFRIFPKTDPLPGPGMRSTGQALGLSHSAGRAFFKSREATGIPLPLEGTVLITVADKDKPGILESARIFREQGFRIMTTRGTRRFLEANGIPSDAIRKMGYGRPDITDVVKSGEVDLVINTPSGLKSQEDDSYIRKASVTYGVPNITTTASALAAARGIAARRKGKPRIRSLQKYLADVL